MKKIVFCDLPMRTDLYALRYPVDGNKTIEYDGEVIFPINGVLARIMNGQDDVKVVLLLKDSDGNNNEANVQKFKTELETINLGIGAKISYKIIQTPFEETRKTHEYLYREMIGQLEKGAELIVDITYGPKPLPIIMFSVMNFAERFFGCEIQNIVYGKVDFVSSSKIPVNPVIYDLTPLYTLNGLMNEMKYSSAEEAVKALDLILSL